MTPDAPVLHGEFDQFKDDVVRRLDGHDGLYGDMSAARAELGRFTEALKAVREQLTGNSTDRKECQDRCHETRCDFERRIRSLERFHWKLIGVVAVVLGIPSIGTFIILMVAKFAEGGLP